jgi:hypothetical protein
MLKVSYNYYLLLLHQIHLFLHLDYHKHHLLHHHHLQNIYLVLVLAFQLLGY